MLLPLVYILLNKQKCAHRRFGFAAGYAGAAAPTEADRERGAAGPSSLSAAPLVLVERLRYAEND
eukprot:6199907-Pleurochrysis_carterae.AAC.4